MALDDFIKIVDEIKTITPYIYLHVLGEPLFHPFFEAFLDILDERKMKLQLVTNGTLLNRYQLDRHSCLSKLSISVHSITKDNPDYYKTLDDLLSIDHRFNLELRFFEPQTLPETTKAYLEKLKHQFPFLKTGIKDQFKIKTKTYVRFDTFFKWPKIEDPYLSDYGTCLGAKMMLAILSNGDVTTCCLDPFGHNKLGNIFETPLQDIINSKQYKKVVNDLNNNKLSLKLCQKCSYHQRFL